jgi:hypothetical protein
VKDESRGLYYYARTIGQGFLCRVWKFQGTEGGVFE